MTTRLFARFALHFLIYLFIIGGLAAYPLYKLASSIVIEGVVTNTILFFFLTLISFALVVRAGQKKNGSIVNAFLASIVIKMLVSLVYFLLLLSSFKGHEIEFAITFFSAYLVCTGFEVYYLLYNLRQI